MVLLYLGIILLAGLLFGRLAKLIKLPNVTGYLVAGLLLGPYVLKIIPSDIVNNFSLVSEVSLAFIAFTIGLSFKRSYFKRVGLTPVVIAIFEALIAVFAVQGVLIATGQDLAFSIVLGAIAAATAPAATIMVIKQYKAQGPLTETLLSVVAIDDAVALIAFSFAVTIAKAISGTGATSNIALSIIKPFGEVFLALAIGAVSGLIIKLPLKYFKKSGNRLIIACGFIFITAAVCDLLGLSSLLACMTLGAVFCNVSDESDLVADIVDKVTPPIFLMFFVISGAELNINVIPSIGIVGILYVVVRVIGKMLGAFLGAKIMRAPKSVCRWLGPTLIPQAGVAIGLTLVAQEVVPEFAPTIRAVILCGTMIYEIFGPVITKISLVKAGEIKVEKSKKLTK
ncbi:MAG: cation/H(+) antiporter [Clostridiales bacterium]|nr:MAG: cation/H(+) antiporter [Clostridiales bacterium]